MALISSRKNTQKDNDRVFLHGNVPIPARTLVDENGAHTGTSENPLFTEDFLLQVGLGNVSGYSLVHKFGRNPTVASGVWEGVWAGSETFNFLTAATTVRIKAGGNGADTAAGAGAQSVTVEGIDSTGAFTTEAIETAGASASTATSTAFWRVYRAYITEGRVGAYGVANTADIMIENSGGGTDLNCILAGEGQSQYGAYAIPLGKTGYLMSFLAQTDGLKAADFRIFTRENLTDFTTPFSPKRVRLFFDGVLGSVALSPKSPIFSMDALTDIWVEAEGGGAITEVSCDFEILLKDD